MFFKNKKTLPMVLVGLAFVSCAVEPLRLNQPIGVPVAQNKVNGFDVRVSIEDVRGTQQLGSRGGVYSETSMITTDNALVDQIGDNFIQAMKNQGYQLVPKAPANMQVKLESLTYDVNEVNTTTKDSDVKVEMSFYIEHEKGYMQKNFKVTVSQTTVLLPTQKSIESMVSDALIKVMQKGLDDKEIQSFIASSQSLDLIEATNPVSGQTTNSMPVESPSGAQEQPSEIKQPVAPVESKTYKILL
ncbi:YajG family lipoprotein [Marinicellulosiphila megalodicopiae]|uniref:YajG family lipoprotein n=1 Tax=Marinicellulosiphila megalodicopiae TaxID=2724896 RepID=UPI003BB1419A